MYENLLMNVVGKGRAEISSASMYTLFDLRKLVGKTQFVDVRLGKLFR